MIPLLILLFSCSLAVTPNAPSSALTNLKIASTKHLPVSPPIPARNSRRVRRTNKKIKGQRKIAAEQIAQSRSKELASGKTPSQGGGSSRSNSDQNSEDNSESFTDDYDFGTVLSSIAEDDSVFLTGQPQDFALDGHLSPHDELKADSNLHPSDEEDDKPNWVSIDKPKEEDEWSVVDDQDAGF